MNRLKYSIKNAKVALLFYLFLLVLNFFSRRVFIDSLGNDLVGLTAAVQSYIGMLNLADLGISAAITALLYAPLYAADQRKITEIVSIYGYLFRWVGIAIGVGGIILSLFLPMLFAGDGVDMWAVYAAFYAFLTTTLLSYLVNYKQNLLVANQKNYVVVTILNTTTITKTIIQIVLLKWFGCGFVTWLALEICSAVAFAIWLEIRINREYPWLRTNIRAGRKLLSQYPEATRNIKRVFSHKIAGFVVQQSGPIVVQLIMGVAMVTYYTNYTIIVARLTQLVVGTLLSNFAGVGHLIAEGNKPKIKLVFWQLNAMYFWIGGVVAFGFCTFVSPLMTLWIPGTHVFDSTVVMLMSANLYIHIIRQPVGYYVNGYSLFGDTAAAWVEASVNLSISITFGIMYGIIGVVAGTAISTFLIVILWRSHYLYTRGFGEQSGAEFWLTLGKYIAILAIVWFGAVELNLWLFGTAESWSELFIYAPTITLIMAVIYAAALWLTSRGMRDFARLVRNILTKTSPPASV